MGDAGVSLRLDAVSKRYARGLRPAVDGVSLSIAAGTAVGLLGANGAGKTTTVRMLTGLLPPDSGTIEVVGGDPRDPRVRARIGYVPEQPAFPPGLSARQVLDYVAPLFRLSPPLPPNPISTLPPRPGLPPHPPPPPPSPTRHP